MEPLEQQLTGLVADQKAFVLKFGEELKLAGATSLETKEALAKVHERMEKAQTQLDALDSKIAVRFLPGGEQEQKTIGDLTVESEEFKKAAENGFRGRGPTTIHLKTGAFPVRERKTNITDATLGGGSSGVLMPTRLPGITILAQQELRIRDIMSVRPLPTGNTFDWVRQTTRTNAPSPQVEAVTKAESTYLWDAQSGTIRTIAHFTNVSRQALDDVAWLRALIDGELQYGLKVKEESEILAGSGVGEHLNGLITQGTAYDTVTYNVSGDTKLDILRHAKLQARLAGLATYAPEAYVLHPTDMEKIELLKTEEGGANKGLYIVGDPKTGAVVKFVWGLPVVESDSITAGTFLVGAFSRAAELIDRMAATVDISYEHASNFTANLATILCEERVGLAVRKPGAFIYGSSY